MKTGQFEMLDAPELGQFDGLYVRKNTTEWDVPFFELEEAQRLAKALKGKYKAAERTFVFKDDGMTIRYVAEYPEGREGPLWAIGYQWRCWSLVESED